MLARSSSSEARVHRSLASAEAAAFYSRRLGGLPARPAPVRTARRSLRLSLVFGHRQASDQYNRALDHYNSGARVLSAIDWSRNRFRTLFLSGNACNRSVRNVI